MFCCFVPSTSAFLLVCFCSRVFSFGLCQHIHWNRWRISCRLTCVPCVAQAVRCLGSLPRWSPPRSRSPDHQWQQFLWADGFSSNRRLACFTEHHSGAGYGDVATFSTWVWRGANLRSHGLAQWFLYIVIFQLVLNSFNFVWSLGKYAGEMWVSGPEECPQDLSVFCGMATSGFAGPSKCLNWSTGRARSQEDASRAESALPAEAKQAKAQLSTPCMLSTEHPPAPAAPEGFVLLLPNQCILESNLCPTLT